MTAHRNSLQNRALLSSALASLLLLPAGGASQSQERIQWLRDACIELATIEPEDDDFSDLEPLKELIGDAQVVQLGKQSHGDGAAFLAKGQLIRFLHQEMGFDVLAFESGLYDCRKAWEALEAGTPPLDAVKQGVFGIWTGSAQVRPVIDYLGEAANSDRPLELVGFDCQFTGAASAKHLIGDLRAFVSAVDPPLYDDEDDDWAMLESTVGWLVRWSVSARALNRDSRMGALEKLSRRLARPEVESAHSRVEVEFWRQLTRSMIGQARQIFDKIPSGRDQQMGENLVWLARERYPDRKIIVWAATFHVMRNAPEITVHERPGTYADTVTMGHVAWQELGEDCFTIGFTAFEGAAGRFWTPAFELDPSPAGSLEALLAAAGFEYAILPLRDVSPGGEWLHEGVTSRPLGYADMRADWSRHMDAMLFTRQMTPSTRKREPRRPRRQLRLSKAAREAAGDLLPRLEETWQKIHADIDKGSRLADQLDFTAVVGRWQEIAAPDAGQIVAAQDEVSAWLELELEDSSVELAAELTWRAELLFARLAGGATARRDHLERALASFPERTARRARPEDRMPQLVGELAFEIWESEGFAAALELAATMLASDRRLRILDTDPWLRRLSGEESATERAQFLDRIRAACAERAERFPEHAVEARRFGNRLR